MKFNIDKIIFNEEEINIKEKSLIIKGHSGSGKTPFIYLLLISLGNAQVKGNYYVQYGEKNIGIKMSDIFLINYSIYFLNNKFDLKIKIKTEVWKKGEGKMEINCSHNDKNYVFDDPVEFSEYIKKIIGLPKYINYEGKVDESKIFDFIPYYSLVRPDPEAERDIYSYRSFIDGKKTTKMAETRFISAGILRRGREKEVEIIKKISEIPSNEFKTTVANFHKKIKEIMRSSSEGKIVSSEGKWAKINSDLIQEISQKKINISDMINKTKRLAYEENQLNQFRKFTQSQFFDKKIDKEEMILSFVNFLETSTQTNLKKEYLLKKIKNEKKELKILNKKREEQALIEEKNKILKLYEIELDKINENEVNTISDDKNGYTKEQKEIMQIFWRLWNEFWIKNIKPLTDQENSITKKRKSWTIAVGVGGEHSNRYIEKMIPFYKLKQKHQDILVIDNVFDNVSSEEKDTNKKNLISKLFETDRQIIMTIKESDIDNNINNFLELRDDIVMKKFEKK